MDTREIVERIMTAHWDIFRCRCWVCKAGRDLGFSPKEEYLLHKESNQRNFPVPSFQQEEMP